MRKVFLWALICSLTISCNKDKDDDNTPAPAVQAARVMYTNACISTGALRVHVNDTPVQAVTGVAYLASSGYTNVGPATNAKHTFVLQDSNIPLTSTNIDLVVNNYYSVFAAGTVTNPTAIAVQDDLSAPPAGSAKVRFINLSPDNLNESVYIGSSKVDSNIVFGGVTPFRQVTAGTYQVIVQDPNNVPSSRTLSGQNLEAGKIYTILLTGTLNGSGNTALTLSLTQNL